MSGFSEKKVSAQFFLNVADMPGDDGLIDV
jgi:hypothetical protein